MTARRKTAWQFDTPVPWADEVFRQILQFYLFECPTPGASARGRDFATFGWKDTKHRAELKKAMLQSASGSLVYKSCDTKAEVAVALGTLGIADQVPLSTEHAVFCISRTHVIEALYVHIRNAFAHGRFFVSGHGIEATYVFEDSDRGVLTARLILKASTLVSWTRIVRGTPEHLDDPASSPAAN